MNKTGFYSTGSFFKIISSVFISILLFTYCVESLNSMFQFSAIDKSKKGDVTIGVEVNGISPTVMLFEPTDPVMIPLASAIELLLSLFLGKLNYVPSYTALSIVFLKDSRQINL